MATGKEYEHDLAKQVFEASDGKIIPIRCGMSGNQALPSADLMIPFGGALVAMELKTTKRDSSIIIEPEDIEQIGYWTLRMSEVPVYPRLGIKFKGQSSRLLYTTRLSRVSDPQKCFEREVEKCPFDAKVTRSGNLSFRKPDTDEWYSTQAGDGPSGLRDGYRLLEDLRNDDFDQPSVLEVIKERDDYFETMG